MKLSPPPWPLSCLLVLLPWPLATATSTAPRQCPPGQEPNVEPGRGTLCRSCPPGTFSASWGSRPCQPHSHCSSRGRLEAQEGTATQDALCGDCQPGWFSPAEAPGVPCQPCARTPLGGRSCHERGQRVRRGVEVAAGAGSAGETWQPGNSTRAGSPEETAAQYAVIAIVPIFCLMGLLGILVCNLLKRKGYHCTAQKEVGPGPGGGGSGTSPACRPEDTSEDTIGVLVRLITEKKENAAALEELLKEYHSRQLVQTGHRPLPRLSPGPPSMPHVCPHRHTNPEEPVKHADFVRSKSFLLAPAKPPADQRPGAKLRLQEGLQRGVSLSHQNLAAPSAVMMEKELHQLKRASYSSTDQPSWMELARKKSQAWSDMPQIIK